MKTNRMKKLSFFLFAAVVAVGLFFLLPERASAETYFGTCGANGNEANATWALDTETGVLTISGTGAIGRVDWGDFQKEIRCPWYLYKNQILHLVIENGITDLIGVDDDDCQDGFGIFKNHSSLLSVSLPSSLKSIGYHAFSGCTGLTSVTIPDSVTSIGSSAFSDCTGLTSITIPDSVTSIGRNAFRDCTGLTSITIPNSVTSIGDWAFSGCTNLQYNVYDQAKYLGNSDNPYVALVKANSTSITACSVNRNTKFICGSAFQDCTGLTTVTIASGVTRIGSSAFYGCTGLTTVTIPVSVTSIGTWAFGECHALSTIIYRGTQEQMRAISFDEFVFSEDCFDGTWVFSVPEMQGRTVVLNETFESRYVVKAEDVTGRTVTFTVNGKAATATSVTIDGVEYISCMTPSVKPGAINTKFTVKMYLDGKEVDS